MAIQRTRIAVEPSDALRVGPRTYIRHERLLVFRRGDDELLGMVGVSEIVRGIFQNVYIRAWAHEPQHAHPSARRFALG